MIFRWMDRHQFGVDLIIAGCCAVVFVVPQVFILMLRPDRSNAAALAVACVLFVAVVLRRIRPWTAIGVAWLGALLQMAFVTEDPIIAADMLVFIVLATATSRGTRVLRWSALAMAFVGGAIAATYITYLQPMMSHGSSVGLDSFGQYLIIVTACLLISWLIGFLIHLSRDYRNERTTRIQIEADQRIADQQVRDEAERAEIARDMHDILAHSLAVIIAQADGARMFAMSKHGNEASSRDTQTLTSLKTISNVSREALANVRGLLQIVRGDKDDAAVGPGLKDLPELYVSTRASGIALVERQSGEPRPLDVLQELVIYRFAQEALTNALRHGGPGTNVDVHFNWATEHLSVVIVNDDQGHDPMGAGSGYGQRGMRERALSIGATVDIEPGPSSYRVALVVPFREPQPERQDEVTV